MSVSIDDNPSGDRESAASVLGGWLDDYHAGRCDRADMEEAFISVCSTDAEAPWDALSLLDRYQRLGRIEVDVARELKSKISQIAVGAPKASAARPKPPSRPPVQQEASDEPSSVAPNETFDIEPMKTAIRRPASEDTVVPAPIPLRNAEEEEEDEEEEEELDDESIPPPTPEPRRTVSFAERASQLRKAGSARQAPAQTPIPQRQREMLSPRPRVSAAPTRRVLRDRYELLSVLGHGQSSTIYKALDRHRANLAESARYVAVKVLNAALDTQPEALAELEREFHQAQSLSHPNIASVFDLDRDERTYFIVMELLEGDSLASILRRLNGQPMERKKALSLIGSIGAALAHAHRRDVVHGDLKPRNVMITSSGEVRVLEFGFARSRSAQRGELHDEHGNVSIGTPAYASAERVHGLAPDPSDDVYSLACIAYELLSGRHPYGGRSAFLARAHGRRPARINGLSHRQWHALQRALAWDRADRRIDVVDLLSALGTGESGHDPMPPELLSIPDDVRGRRLRRLGAVAAVIAVVAFAVYFFVTRVPPPVQSADVAATTPAPTPSDALPDATAPSQTGGEATSENAAVTSAPTPAEAQAPSAAQEPPRSETVAQAPSASEGSAEASPRTTPAPAGTPVTIEFSKDTYVVTESDGAVSLEVRRTGSTRNAVSFRWSLRSNSAEAGSDFADIGPGVEQMPPGVRSATILIPLVSDTITENTELFLVELEAIEENVRVGELGAAAVIIVDDD